MTRKMRLQVGILLIVTALAYMVLQGAHNFSSYFVTVRAYVANAPKFRHEVVRVQGTLVARSVRYNDARGSLHFELSSGSAHLPVVYRGAMPNERFRNASAIVKGRMGAHGVFQAQKLEIQCPDHYTPAREPSS